MLVKTPGLTAVAVFALAVGIPVGLLPGHLVNAFEAPLPFFEGERIHLLWNFNRESSRGEAPSLYDFSQWRDQLRSFEAIAVSTAGASYNVESEDGRAAPVPGAEVTAETFEILRVAPLLGRTFLRGDEQLGSPSVVVIGYDLWQARLGGVSDVVGRTIRIGGMPHTVIGVMPDGFLFPLRDNLWLPLRMSPHTDEHLLGRAHLVFGRLADGVSPEEAQVEFETVGGRMAQGSRCPNTTGGPSSSSWNSAGSPSSFIMSRTSAAHSLSPTPWAEMEGCCTRRYKSRMHSSAWASIQS